MGARLTPVILFVRDFDRCLDFYGDVLALPPVRVYRGPDHPPWAEFEVGAVRLALHGGYRGAERYAPGRPLTLHFDVDDIQATIERIKRAGGTVKEPAREYDFRPVELERVYATSFTDPEGNEFELQQVLEVFAERGGERKDA
jgi:predicted enzyme related to lactoylglutathione lyase